MLCSPCTHTDTKVKTEYTLSGFQEFSFHLLSRICPTWLKNKFTEVEQVCHLRKSKLPNLFSNPVMIHEKERFVCNMYGVDHISIEKKIKKLTSVFGGEIQNWIRPIFAFSTLFGPPAPEVLLVNTSPSINSVSSTVPLWPKWRKRKSW